MSRRPMVSMVGVLPGDVCPSLEEKLKDAQEEIQKAAFQ